MSARKPYVGGNWKMNLHAAEARALATELVERFDKSDLAPKVEAVVFVPFPYLALVGDMIKDSPIKLGAQDCYHEDNGAFTGEVSLSQLKDVGVDVILTGHSERRHVIGESDVLVNAKTRAALDAGLEVILCVGEKIEQREAGMTNMVNIAQTCYGLAGTSPDQMARVTIAYEPVWAIGTGKTATPQDAQDAHLAIRQCVWSIHGEDIANAMRIQYGGSMKPASAPELCGQSDIDGGLIGGAALKADDFLGILDAAASSAG